MAGDEKIFLRRRINMRSSGSDAPGTVATPGIGCCPPNSDKCMIGPLGKGSTSTILSRSRILNLKLETYPRTKGERT